MNERIEEASHVDLLAAIVLALDVPLPATAADQAAYHRLLERCIGQVQSLVALMLAYGAGPWHFASVLRQRITGRPANYTPFEYRRDEVTS
ncbi:hypothetical protein [Streptomyces sp. NPDC017949]|uniref:hypothetical protein n=1 Tax=Streptomyces sp. NPDC017949 TaxID=3365020 RepID=UPI0037B03D67